MLNNGIFNSDIPEVESQPIVEEPESPEVIADSVAEQTDAVAEISEDEQAEPDVTDEE